MEKKDTLSSCSDSEIQQMQLIQIKSKESCMVSFQRLHSHLKCLSNNDLKGSRTEEGFKRAFATLFGQDLETFTGTMFLYMDQLQKQLDNEEFQEIGSMSAFKVLQTQFQMFIKSRFYLDDEYVDMIRNKFLQYTRLAIPEFRDTLNQHMESVKKSIGERAQHKMQYERRVNERQIQTTEEKTDTSNALDALDASSVIIESNGTESKEQDTSSRSGNDAHVDDADIRPINNEEPMAEVQMTADDNVSATGQQHTEQPEFINEGEVDQNAEQYHEIQDLKAQMQDKNIAISELKKLIENCKGKSVETQFNKPYVVRQPNAQRIPKPSVLGKPTPFSNSPEMRSFQTKQSVNKTNVSDGLFKQVTQQNLPQIRKQAVRNTNVIAPGPSRNFPKHVSHQSPREKVGSNDMVHNYYLEKAKKSAQLQKDKEVNGKPSVIDPARLPNTANGCKPKPRNWQASMSSRVSNKDVHLGEHRKQKPFLKFNELQCPTCKKCLYSANHDECVLEYLSRLNPRASAQNKDAKSHKTTKRYMPVEKSSASKKPERQIPTGHRFSNKKTTTVPEKTMNPRSCLRWKPTGRIFSNVRLRWVPTGRLFNSCTSKVESEPTHGSNVDIYHIHACKQTLGLSAGTSFNGKKQQRIDITADALYNEKQENLRVWLLKFLISKKPVPEWFHKR
ncbi:hypothetical protein Tco_0001741 [Tanacetum coccineum]